MGEKQTDAKDVVMLNRKVQWTREGLRLATEPRHVKDIVQELGLTQAKPADTSETCESDRKTACDSTDLGA